MSVFIYYCSRPLDISGQYIVIPADNKEGADQQIKTWATENKFDYQYFDRGTLQSQKAVVS